MDLAPALERLRALDPFRLNGRVSELIGLVVAGGPGTHSVYVPGYGVARSVTRAIDPEPQPR